MSRITVLFCIFACPCLAQSFEVASVRVSRTVIGHEGVITTGPQRFAGHNATLKRLVFEAWQTPYDRITGGPAWVNSDEYDVEAKASAPVSLQELRLMLRTLLAERFKLQVHTEKREGRVYALVAAKSGPKLGGPLEQDAPGLWIFHGDLSQFADVLALKLTMPMQEDPTVPAVARGTPVPVINKTGIEGIFDFALKIRPDRETDTFMFWQRTLQDQLGLRLESQKDAVEFLVIDHVERAPSAN
jgi:uncharacterized protein (TIGR03435 family)